MGILDQLMGRERHSHSFETLVLRALAAILHELVALRRQITSTGATLMADIDQVTTEIQKETTLIAGVGTLISNLQQQIADATAGAKVPADVQAKIDAVFAQAQQNTAALSQALSTQPSGQPVTDAPADGGSTGTAPGSSPSGSTGTGDDAPTGDVDATTGKPAGQ